VRASANKGIAPVQTIGTIADVDNLTVVVASGGDGIDSIDVLGTTSYLRWDVDIAKVCIQKELVWARGAI
jgi:hypothetical protein